MANRNNHSKLFSSASPLTVFLSAQLGPALPQASYTHLKCLLLHLVPDPRVFNVLIRKLPPTSEDRHAATRRRPVASRNFSREQGGELNPWSGRSTARERRGRRAPQQHPLPFTHGPACPTPLPAMGHPGSTGTPKAPQLPAAQKHPSSQTAALRPAF